MRLFSSVLVLSALLFSGCSEKEAHADSASPQLFVEWHGSWWAAHAIGRTNDGRAVVHYDGWGNEWDEIVTSSRVARPTNDGKLFVEWRGSWWPATILSTEKNGALRVHYDGWGSEWDETVDASRVLHLSPPRQ